MAVISKQEIVLAPGKKFMRVVKYSSTTRLFTIELPYQLCHDIGLPVGTLITGHTEGEAIRLFEEKLSQWRTVSKEVTKVIIFDVKFQGGLFLPEHYAEMAGRFEMVGKEAPKYIPAWADHGSNSRQHQYAYLEYQLNINASSLGLTLDWGVYEKTTVLGNSTYHWGHCGRTPRSNASHWSRDKQVEIEWTQERQDFFMHLDQAFAEMIAKVYKGLGDLTPEKLSTLADSGAKLLG